MKAKSKVSAWPEVRRSSGRKEMKQTSTCKIFRVWSLQNVGIGTHNVPNVCRAGCMRRSILSSTPACRQKKIGCKMAACRMLEVLAGRCRSKWHLFPEGLADVDVLLADVARHQHAVVGQCQRNAERVVASVHSCEKSNTSIKTAETGFPCVRENRENDWKKVTLSCTGRSPVLPLKLDLNLLLTFHSLDHSCFWRTKGTPVSNLSVS